MVFQGAIKVATMLAVSTGHMIEANSNELMRLIGRRRRRGKEAVRSAGEPFVVDEWQGIASILRPLGRIMFQPSSACRLHHSIRELPDNASAGSSPRARPGLVRVVRI